MVEQLTVNQPVVGSNPASGAILNNKKKPRRDVGAFFIVQYGTGFGIKNHHPLLRPREIRLELRLTLNIQLHPIKLTTTMRRPVIRPRRTLTSTVPRRSYK